MKNKTYSYLYNLQIARMLNTYGDEGDGGSGDGGPGDGGSGDDTGAKFTQEDVNRFVAEERRKTESRISKLSEQMKAFKEKGITPDHVTELETKLNNLRTQYQTKEQQQKEAAKAKEQELTGKMQGLEQEAKTFKEKFSNVVINNSILEAATSAEKKASNPKLFVEILRPKTTLEAVVDDAGNPTGEYAPKVAFDTTDDKGNPVQLALSPTEAIKRMAADTANYGGLFASTQRGGFNAGEHGSGNFDVTDQASYDALRASGQHKNIGS